MDRHNPAAQRWLQLGGLLGTQTADCQSGSGKWMAVQILVGDAELGADLAYLVLVERRERLDDAAVVDQLLDTGYSVVMGLDEIGLGRAAGFDGVGINGALAENPVAVQEVSGLEDAVLHGDELFADD